MSRIKIFIPYDMDDLVKQILFFETLCEPPYRFARRTNNQNPTSKNKQAFFVHETFLLQILPLCRIKIFIPYDMDGLVMSILLFDSLREPPCMYARRPNSQNPSSYKQKNKQKSIFVYKTFY